MEITDVDVHDAATLDAIVDVVQACGGVDAPASAPLSRHAFHVGSRQPEDNQRRLRRVARVDGRVVGAMLMDAPLRENRHFCDARIVVHPDHRRGGIGTALLQEALRLAREQERRVLACETVVTGDWDGAAPRPDAGARLLREQGFTLALTSLNQRLDARTLDSDALSRLHEAAVKASADYETIAWSGQMPEELMGPVSKLNSIFLNEAPLGELDLEPEVFDAERTRQELQRMRERGAFACGVVALPRGSREVVANTLLVGHHDTPGYVHQEITLVDPGHRGHRLGMRVKVENLWQLLREHPDTAWIHTDNAAVNDHMIAINRDLGFVPVDHLAEYQREGL